MTHTSIKTMFTVAALFNFTVAALLLVIPSWFLGLMHISPGIESTVWVHEFAGVVLTFGMGYYWISRDPYGNRILSLRCQATHSGKSVLPSRSTVTSARLVVILSAVT